MGRAGVGCGREDGGMSGEAESGQKETAEGMPKLRLRRLKIHRWRNVLPGTELHFGDGIHALLGKNGTGKTTLLRLLSMFSRGTFTETEGEEFDAEVDVDIGQATITMRVTRYLAQETAPAQLPVDVNLWGERVELKIERPELSATIRRDGDRMTIRREKGPEIHLPPSVAWAVNLSFPWILSAAARMAIADDPKTTPVTMREIHDAFRDTASTVRYDEMLGFLALMSGESSDESRRGHVYSLSLRISHRKNETNEGSLLARQLLEALHERPRGGEKTISFSARELPFLDDYARLTKVNDVEMVLRLREARKKGDYSSFDRAEFLFKLRDGDTISIEDTSYGQRRLLSFLYYAACNPSILIADELTNGLHHEWIEACVDELEKRQSFVASQNPLLLDYLPVSSAKDAETAFIQCRLVEQDGKQWMHWRNTTPEEAERFWKSYETGVQFISEILRTEGLW